MPTQIDRIRDTFVHVLFDTDRASWLFYDRLFLLAPEARTMFTADLAAQGRALIGAMSTIVTGLDRFDTIAPILRDLAVRHVAYGVEPRHYPPVGDALIHMLTEVGGGAFDESARAAWNDTYALIAETMISAAYPPAAA